MNAFSDLQFVFKVFINDFVLSARLVTFVTPAEADLLLVGAVLGVFSRVKDEMLSRLRHGLGFVEKAAD